MDPGVGWELSKENIQPIKKGRTAESLKEFGERKHGKEDIERQRKNFELMIANEDAEDPLEDWVTYIRWIQNTFMENTDGELEPVLNRCLRKFLRKEQFKNDIRFLRMWLLYADLCEDPTEIFRFLRKEGIGQSLALYYEAFAVFLENKKNFTAADKVFAEGVRCKAYPEQKLQKAYDLFNQKWAEKKKQEEEDRLYEPEVLAAPSDENDQRAAFSRLHKSQGTRSNAQVSSFRPRGPDAIVPGKLQVGKKSSVVPTSSSSSSTSSKFNFTIFEDSAGKKKKNEHDVFGDSANQKSKESWTSIPNKKKDHKENTQKPSKWTNNKIPQNRSLVAEFSSAQSRNRDTSSNSFDVYIDEELAQMSKRESKEKNQTTIEKLRILTGPTAAERERIKKNPVLNITDPPIPVTEASTTASSSQNSAANLRREEPGYNRALVFVDGFEYSFEEVRAVSVGYFPGGENEPSELCVNDVEMEDISSDAYKTDYENEHSEVTNPPAAGPEEEEEEVVEYKQSHSAPSPTVHTKKALSDVFSMFSSPLDEDGFGRKHNTEEKPSSGYPQQESHSTSRTPSFSIFSDHPDEQSATNSSRQDLEEQENKPPIKSIKSKSILKPIHIQPLPLGDNAGESEEPNVLERSPSLEDAKKSMDFVVYEDPHCKRTPSRIEKVVEVTGLRSPLSEKDLDEFYEERMKEVEQEEEQIAQMNKNKDRNNFAIYEDNADTARGKRQSVHPEVESAENTANFSEISRIDPTLDQSADISKHGFDKLFTPFGDSSSRSNRRISKKGRFSTTSVDSLSLSVCSKGSAPPEISPLTTDSSRSTNISSQSFGRKLEMEEKGNEVVEEQQPSAIGAAEMTVNINRLVKDVPKLSTTMKNTLDPYDPKVVEEREKKTRVVLKGTAEYLDYSDRRGPDLTALDECKKGKSGELQRQMKFDLGDRSVTAVRSLGKGAFAKVYEVYEESSMRLAMKIQKPASSWEFYLCQQASERVQQENPLFTHSLPLCHSLYMYEDVSLFLMECNDSCSLQDLVNICRMRREQNMKGMEETVIIFYTVELLRIVQSLHSQGIIHGDVKPDNLLLRFEESDVMEDWSPEIAEGWGPIGLMLIDFGRGIDLQMYSKDIMFVGNCQASGFECIEMKEGRPWKYQIDTYGICACVYLLLHLEYMEVVQVETEKGKRWAPRNAFKRYWQVKLWEKLFDTLLNLEENANVTDVLSSLRKEFEDYLIRDPFKRKSIITFLRQQNNVIADYLPVIRKE